MNTEISQLKIIANDMERIKCGGKKKKSNISVARIETRKRETKEVSQHMKLSDTEDS